MQRLIATCAFLVLAAAGGAYAGFATGLSHLEDLEFASRKNEAMLSERLGELESTVLLLAGETETIRAGQESYAQAQTEEEKALRDALSKLSDTVSAQESELTTLSRSSDKSGIIAAWSPYVYEIVCSFEVGSAIGRSRGSAVVERSGGTIRFITNRHVVENDAGDLIDCELAQAGSDANTITVRAPQITLSDDHDVAYGVISAPIAALDATKRCTEAPTIGDSVVILGYPTIGAKESVTATEGIISGFDKTYYTTSAKIERGNSGGAAIDVERGCFLGLPTLVFTGKIESLARILPVALLQ